MNKKNMFFGFALLLLILIPSFINAAFTSQTETDNHLSMDTVNISIKTMMKDEKGQETPYIPQMNLVPGQDISMIPLIQNFGADCYIRVKAEIDMDMEKGLTEENFLGISSDWKLIGDTFYYQKVLKEEEVVRLFDSIHLPENWDESYMSLCIGVDLKAEAVQAKHFTPDFDSEAPWGSVVVEKTVRTREEAVNE